MGRAAVQVLGAGLISALVCALTCSLWEVIGESARLELPGSALHLVGAWFVSFSLVFGVLAAWTVALIGPVLVVSRGRPGDAAHRLVSGARDAFRIRKDDPDRIASAFSLAVSVALFAGATYAASSFCIDSFNKPALVAAAITCFSLVALAGSWLVRITVRAAMVRIGRSPWLRPPWYSFPVVAGAAGVAACAAVFVVSTRWSAWLPGIRVVQYVQIGTSFLLHFAAGVLLLARCRHDGTVSGGKRGAKSFARGLGPSVLLLGGLTVCLPLTLGPVGSHPGIRRDVLALEGQTSVWSNLVRMATDFDGDGYTHYMGGGDCAPYDSAVAPGRLDVADNGVDEDCFEGDFRTGVFLTSQDPEWYRGEDLVVRQYDVVIIGGDGINFSRTTMGGNTRDTTPFLDRWSREKAVVFEKAYCSVPYTGFSHLAMFTGALPLSIAELGEGIRDKSVLPEHLTSLPEYLKGLGYRTFGVDTTVLKWAPWIDRGIDRLKYLANGKAEDVSHVVLDMFRKRDKDSPFFLWAFYYDAHHPYIVEGMEDLPSFGNTPVDQYDKRLLFWDRQLETLFEELGPKLDNAIVIFYSDHGEEVNADEWLGHGKKLTESHVRVPLIISVPGLRPGRMSEPVSLIDVFPTLVNFIEGAASPNPFEGKSLTRRMVTGEEPAGRLVFTETYRGDVRYAVTDGRFKLLYNLTDNQTSFFDLIQDPLEKNGAGRQHLAEVAQLERAVRHYVTGSRGYWRNKAISTAVQEQPPPGMAEPLAMFDDVISLLGVRATREGRRVFLDVFYRCEKEMDEDYRSTTHIIRKGDGKFRNHDHVPVSPVFGTSEWSPGMVYHDRFELPRKCRAVGQHDIWVGFHKGRKSLVASSSLLPLRENKVLLNAALSGKGPPDKPKR